jgi:hypothetical protein
MFRIFRLTTLQITPETVSIGTTSILAPSCVSFTENEGLPYIKYWWISFAVFFLSRLMFSDLLIFSKCPLPSAIIGRFVLRYLTFLCVLSFTSVRRKDSSILWHCFVCCFGNFLIEMFYLLWICLLPHQQFQMRLR